MRSYFKGILVGISIVIGSLLLMGYKSHENNGEVGRYQIINVNYQTVDFINSKKIDQSTMIKIDTKTGKVFQWHHHLDTNSKNESEYGYFWSDITEAHWVE